MPTGIRPPGINHSIPSFLLRRFNLSRTLTLTLTLAMGSQGGAPPKRPFCLRCSKPSRLCLCSRIRAPPIDNPVAVTVLQHSLERNHPLNSTRIAKLGLRNLAVVHVTDVNFKADLHVRPLDPSLVDRNRSDTGESPDLSTTHVAVLHDSDRGVAGGAECCTGDKPDHREIAHSPTTKESCVDIKPESTEISDLSITQSTASSGRGVANGVNDAGCGVVDKLNLSEDHRIDISVADAECGIGDAPDSLRVSDLSMADRGVPNSAIDAECGIGDGYSTRSCDRYSVTSSHSDIQITIGRSVKPDIRWILDSPIGRAVVSNGFVVEKIQRKQLPGTGEFEDFEEFKITMPPGSALLFPSSRSISLREVDFEVKQLVVLDGTWAKATRIYYENPWLQFLPHLKLDSVGESLYSEVRLQPKAGFLSTIESIICAMKGLGHDMDGLDNILEVFESMVADQRRCKVEKFRELSNSGAMSNS